MKSNSPFKYVYWGLIVLVAASLLGVTSMFTTRSCAPCGPTPIIRGMPFVPMHFLLYFFVILYVTVVGWLVFRDASKRGMDPWLWATVATFVPYLIGVIIYLVVSRTGTRAACLECGQALRHDYKVCPHCGHARELLCPKCQKPVK